MKGVWRKRGESPSSKQPAATNRMRQRRAKNRFVNMKMSPQIQEPRLSLTIEVEGRMNALRLEYSFRLCKGGTLQPNTDPSLLLQLPDLFHRSAKTVLGSAKLAAFIRPISQVNTSFPSKEKAMVKPTYEMYPFPGVTTKLFECRCDRHDSVYFCGRCSLKITEEDVVGHVADLNHQKMRRVVVNLGENAYNNISKQSFHSALHTLKALHLQRNSLNKHTSTPSSARPVNTSAALRVQCVGPTINNFEVVDTEIDSGAVIRMPMTKTVQVPSSSNKAQTKTLMNVSQSAGSFHPYQRTVKVSPKGSNLVRLLPYSRGNGSKDVNPNAICKRATMPTIKRSAVISPTTSKCIKTSSTITGTTSTPRSTFSKMASTSKIVPMSRTLERESGSASKAKSDLFTTPRSTGMHKATCRTDSSSRNRNAPRCTETATNASIAFQTKVPYVATSKGLKHGSENANASKTAPMKNSLRANSTVGPRADKRNLAVAPLLKTTLTEASEHKKQHKEPSCISAGTKLSGNHPKVGLNQLIIVSWEGKQQVYCQLCSVRLKRSDHPSSLSHHYNYVKMKYPGWTAVPAELESKLNNIVAHLVEVEKNVGSQNAQMDTSIVRIFQSDSRKRKPLKVEVKKDVYQKLALLPEDKAVERVKAMVRPRDPRVSSSDDIAEVVRQEVASPCEVSSSDDASGVPRPYNKMPGFPAKSQLKQETKIERQKLLDQITEMKSRLTMENDLAVYQSVRGQSLDGDTTQVGDLIQDQFQSSIISNKKHPLPIPAPSSQTEVIAETTQQKPFEPDGNAQPHSEIPLVTLTPVIKVERSDHSEHLVNPDNRQKWKSDPASWEPQKDQEIKRELTPYQFNSRKVEAATASTGQLNPSGPSHTAGPGESNTSQTFTVTSAGRIIQGCSHLSIFLKARRQDAKPVIGMGLMWECRGISLETFFLCESCTETLSCRDICQHMASMDHQLKYIWMEHPEFLQMFWNDKNLPSYEKMNIVKLIVQELAERERFHKVDAQCVLLGQELHQFVKTSSFCEALKMVYDIKDEEKPSIVFLPVNQSSQQPEDWHNLLQKGQMARTTDQRSDDEAEQKMETSHSERMSTVGVSEIKAVSSRWDMNCSPEKVESVSPVPSVGTCLTPQDTCSGLYMQAEFKPAVSLLPISDPLLHVKKVAFDSTSLATVSSTIGQNPEVSPRNECLPNRKRSADTAEDLLPAKCMSSPVQFKDEASSPSIYKFPSVNPAVNSPPMSLKCEDTGPNNDEPGVDWKLFSELISVLKKSNFQGKKSPSESVPINPCATNSSETVTSRWDSKLVKSKSEAAFNKRRWDSKCLLVKATVRKNN